MSDETRLDTYAKLVQLLSVVVGVVISVVSFNSARETEAKARGKESEARQEDARRYFDQREAESEKRQAEAARPFIELRQKLYLEAVQVAAVLSNPADHTPDEMEKSRKRFRELYVAELSLVEGFHVEQEMMELAQQVDPQIEDLSPAQSAAYRLAHALRDSLRKSWNFKEDVVDNPPRISKK